MVNKTQRLFGSYCEVSLRAGCREAGPGIAMTRSVSQQHALQTQCVAPAAQIGSLRAENPWLLGDPNEKKMTASALPIHTTTNTTRLSLLWHVLSGFFSLPDIASQMRSSGAPTNQQAIVLRPWPGESNISMTYSTVYFVAHQSRICVPRRLGPMKTRNSLISPTAGPNPVCHQRCSQKLVAKPIFLPRQHQTTLKLTM